MKYLHAEHILDANTVEPANNGHPKDWRNMAVMYR